MSEETQQSWWQDFYGQLKDRRVMRVATLYVVLFWPVIQIADILSPALDIPADAMRYLLAVFVLGLPVVMVLSWLYDLNKGGIVRGTADPSSAATTTSQALVGRTFERGLIGVLLLVIAVLFYFQYTSNTVSDTPSPDQPGPRAIAVLPFATFSQNPDDEFFADGLTEELLNVLSRLQDLRVIARTSSFAYKNVSKPVQQIGYELQVDTILEGSVRRSDVGDTIRITAQLVDVETGGHLWSQTFDREFRDVFAIQDEIASAVANELEVNLLANQTTEAKSSNPEALVVVSMGRAELAKRTKQSLEDAVRFFERAVELDPAYAEAHSGLARSHALLHDYGDTKNMHLAKGQASIDRALELDPESADAYATLGLLEMIKGETAQAQDTLARAIAMNPNHAMAHMWMGQLMSDKAERQSYYTRAFDLDPRSAVAGYNLANALFAVGRDVEALGIFDQIIEADPYYPRAYDLVARINESNGRLATAVHNYKQSFELEPSADTALSLAELYIDIGRFDRAEEWLTSASELASESEASRLFWVGVSILAARGERERVEDLLRPTLTEASDVERLMDATQAGYFLAQPEAAVAAWEQALELMKDEISETKPFGVAHMGVAISAAHAYKTLGSPKAEPLLARIETSLNQLITDNARHDSELWYVKAQLAAIRGENRQALVDLQRAIDAGWRQHWRPYFEPCFVEVVKLENFEPMMDGLATRLELMAEELEFDGFFASATNGRRVRTTNRI